MREQSETRPLPPITNNLRRRSDPSSINLQCTNTKTKSKTKCIIKHRRRSASRNANKCAGKSSKGSKSSKSSKNNRSLSNFYRLLDPSTQS
jgi:hypothetical protein